MTGQLVSGQHSYQSMAKMLVGNLLKQGFYSCKNVPSMTWFDKIVIFEGVDKTSTKPPLEGSKTDPFLTISLHLILLVSWVYTERMLSKCFRLLCIWSRMKLVYRNALNSLPSLYFLIPKSHEVKVLVV